MTKQDICRFKERKNAFQLATAGSVSGNIEYQRTLPQFAKNNCFILIDVMEKAPAE